MGWLPDTLPSAALTLVGLLLLGTPGNRAQAHWPHDVMAEVAVAGEGERIIPEWFRKWEQTGLLAWVDKNGDGRVQYRAGAPFEGKPVFDNLFAAGSILAHQDWMRMKCGSGLAMATAYAAVDAFLKTT